VLADFPCFPAPIGSGAGRPSRPPEKLPLGFTGISPLALIKAQVALSHFARGRVLDLECHASARAAGQEQIGFLLGQAVGWHQQKTGLLCRDLFEVNLVI